MTTAYLERVQKLLDARGLTGTERRFRALMRKVTGAFRTRELAGVTAACDALVDAIEGAGEQPKKNESESKKGNT